MGFFCSCPPQALLYEIYDCILEYLGSNITSKFSRLRGHMIKYLLTEFGLVGWETIWLKFMTSKPVTKLVSGLTKVS